MSAVLALRLPRSALARADAPVRTGIDFYWKVIRTKGKAGHFTLADIHGETQDRRYDALQDFLRRLQKAGYVEQVSARVAVGQPVCYRLLKRPLMTPAIRRDGTVVARGQKNRQLWNVMRGPLARGGFTARELALWASTEECRVQPATVTSYLTRLNQAGYLAVLDPGRPGNLARYRLKASMNTGPEPPKILRTRLVFDANLMQIIGDEIECLEDAS